MFNLIIVSSTRFEDSSVHPQEDLYVQFDQAHPAIDQTAYMDAWKKYHKTACIYLPEDEVLGVGNMSKT